MQGNGDGGEVKRASAIVLTLSAACVAAAGCAGRECRVDPIVVGSPALLFDGGASAIASTQIGRSLWPATPGPLESLEEAVFVEYYRDYRGNAFQERNSPLTIFRSYRRGAQVR